VKKNGWGKTSQQMRRSTWRGMFLVDETIDDVIHIINTIINGRWLTFSPIISYFQFLRKSTVHNVWSLFCYREHVRHQQQSLLRSDSIPRIWVVTTTTSISAYQERSRKWSSTSHSRLALRSMEKQWRLAIGSIRPNGTTNCDDEFLFRAFIRLHVQDVHVIW
jgi:hypothetical protein